MTEKRVVFRKVHQVWYAFVSCTDHIRPTFPCIIPRKLTLEKYATGKYFFDLTKSYGSSVLLRCFGGLFCSKRNPANLFSPSTSVKRKKRIKETKETVIDSKSSLCLMSFFISSFFCDSRKFCPLKLLLCLHFLSENKCFSYNWVSFLNDKNLFYNSLLLGSSLSNIE